MAEGKVIITAQNKIHEGLESAKRDLLGFEDATKKVGDTIKRSLTVAAITAGIVELGKATFGAYKEFGEADRRLRQLKIALDGNEESYRKNIELIESLNKVTLASKDDVESLVAELAALGKSDAEIKKIAEAAVNLSNITGQDLNSAFTTINTTYSGTVGRLAQLIPEVKEFTTEQLAAGGAVDLINTKFGDLSKQLAEDDIPQKIKNIQDSWGDLKENLGEAVAPLFNPILDGINRIIEGWNNAAKAADLHNQYLTAASYSQRIMIQEELVSVYEEQLRLFDQSNKATIDRIKKNIEQAKLTGDTQARMMAEDALAVWEGERAKIKTELDIAKASITDLKKEWAATPAAKLAPQDLIPKITLIAETKPAVKPEEKPEAKPEDELGKLVAGAIGKISDLWAPKGISPGIAGGLSFRVAPPSAEEYLAEIADNYESALRAGVENNIKLTQEASRTLAEIEKGAIYSYDAFIAEKTKSIYPSSIIEESLGEPGLSQGIAGGISFKAEIPTADEYLAKMAADYETYVDDAKKLIDEGDRNLRWMHDILGQASVRAVMALTDEAAATLAEIEKENQAYINDAQELVETGDRNIKWMTEMAQRAAVEANLELTRRAVEALREVEQDVEYMFRAPIPYYPSNQVAESFGKPPVLSPGIAGGISFRTALPTQEEIDLKMIAEYEAYLAEAGKDVMTNIEMSYAAARELNAMENERADDLKNLGIAAGQSIAQIKMVNENASLVTKIFAKLIDVTDGVIENYVKVKDSFVQGADSAVYGMISEVMGALGMFGQMLAGVNPILAVLIPIAQGFVDIIGPAITAVLQPVMNVLTQFGQMLAQALLPIFDALLPIISLVAQVMQNNLAPIIAIVATVAAVLASVFDAMTPIIILVAKALTILQSPVEFLADLFSWVGGVVAAFGTNVGIAIWNITHPFSAKAFVSGPGAFTSDAFSGLTERLAQLDLLGTNTGAISTSVSADTASQSASYRTQNITINFYQNAPVVGSGGMTELAQIIRNEFIALDYIGA